MCSAKCDANVDYFLICNSFLKNILISLEGLETLFLFDFLKKIVKMRLATNANN